jgi:Plavaka transposase
MPKPKSALPQRVKGPCPNPNCSNRTRRVFHNLHKHLSQKQDCLAVFMSQHKELLVKALFRESHETTQTSMCLPIHATTNGSDTATDPDDNQFPLDDDVLMNDTNEHVLGQMDVLPNDFEQANFDHFIGPDESQFLVNPNSTVYTNARRVEVTLMKILTELEAPLFAFKVLMDWALDASQSGYNFIPQQESYQSQMQTIAKWVGMEHMRPSVVNVPLPGIRPDDAIPVTTFDFISQLHSLLSDKELNTPANLVINQDAPFTRYTPPDGRLGECLSGSWYNHAWDHMETNTNCTFMIPIIMYIDKTQMSLSGKLSIFPVQMSLGIFTEPTRRKSRAWRPLGFIANEDYYFSAAERDKNIPNVKNERFHTQLAVILHSYRRAQEPNALHNIPLQLGSACKRVNLYVPLQFIIGDVEGGDQLCSRYNYRGAACKRLCRTCDVSTANAARTDVLCHRIHVAHIQNLVANASLQELKDLYQRPGFNALYSIDCGNDPFGVFSMIHTEGLHALEVGLIPYMLEILLKELPQCKKSELDELVKRLTKYPKQHGYAPFPRLLWNDGVTTITQLTGDLKVGKMFAIVAAACTLEGQQFFETNLPGKTATWVKMVYVFQQILCYWAWLKQDTFWMANDHEACQDAIRSIKIMMDQLQTLWPRKDGLIWNLTKIHEQFHVPVDIHRNGNHKNVHTGPQEHNHIPIKNAAKKTQMCKKKLDLQTGERVMERLVIQRAYDYIKERIWEPTKTPKKTSPVLNASKATYVFQIDETTGRDNVNATFGWIRDKHEGLQPLLQEHIMRLLITTTFADHTVNANPPAASHMLEIPFFTEYERNGFVYRAHPNYRGEGAYYDWANVQWEIGHDPVTNTPIVKASIARILGFIQHPSGEFQAIIHSVIDNDNDLIGHGVFGHYWHLEYDGTDARHRPVLRLVSVDSLLEHVCMIPYNINDAFMWVHLWHPSEWPGCFQTILPPGQEANAFHVT